MRGGNAFASLEKQTCKANGVSLTWQSFMPWPDAFFNYHAEVVRNLTGNVTDILKSLMDRVKNHKYILII